MISSYTQYFSVVDKMTLEFMLEFQGIYLCENIRQLSAPNPSHASRRYLVGFSISNTVVTINKQGLQLTEPTPPEPTCSRRSRSLATLVAFSHIWHGKGSPDSRACQDNPMSFVNLC
jgi:hypothetical protein